MKKERVKILKKSRLDNRDILRYLQQDLSSYLRVWVDEHREETSSELIYQGRVIPVGPTLSRNVRQHPSVYWCGGARSAQDYRWKRKKRPPISASALAQRTEKKQASQ
ncbi:hypothetical protein CMI37_27500 [Candidatus Pacearchaeota archaeon]|nr:hypothetical protein [Candidatus Pacearchaeota archaeon]|tara:strand:- start:4000 stop:4323 length:324 start_codon:yes stop_codon:yes gene_type:complete